MTASPPYAKSGAEIAREMKAHAEPSSGVSTGAKFTLRWVEDWDSLAAIRAEWDELAANALEPSPSSESWMLLPALRHLASGAVVKVLLVYAGDHGSLELPPVLCCVFPLQLVTGYKGLPITLLRCWNHCYTLFPAPLLRFDLATECMREIFRWLRKEFPASTLVEFPELSSDSAFFSVLSAILLEDDLANEVVGWHTRAFFRRRNTADDYLGCIGTAHHRHELRRQERRLANMGQLRYERVEPCVDVNDWLDEFVALEMSGWKGKAGSAFGSNMDHLSYLKEIVNAAARRRRLMLLGLRLDGRAIALKLNFLGGTGGHTFKIAFDEAYSKYSPGTLLELENIRQAHADSGINWLDSLALPNHPMMNRVWHDRTAILTVLVAPGRLAGELLVGLLTLLRSLKRGLRSSLIAMRFR